MSSVEAEARELLRTSGAEFVRTSHGGAVEVWKFLSGQIVSIRAKGYKNHDVADWRITLSQIKRTLRAEPEAVAPVATMAPRIERRAKGIPIVRAECAEPVKEVTMTPPVTNPPTLTPSAASTSPPLPPSSGSAAALFAKVSDQALDLSANAEDCAVRARDLLDGLNEATAKLKRAEERVADLEAQLRTRTAELGKFNGRDWPKELERSEAERKKLAERNAHLEEAVRRLVLAGGKA